jgi:uroporphyrin-III C-methyltransferase/precorrin-2 dehydrogenase/sirohydrochlorin ferrochelatase
MQYFPLFVDTKQLNVLVVGGGEVATRKVELLLKSSANITIVSPVISKEIQRFVDEGSVLHIPQYYDDTQLDNQKLVFVATSDSVLNAKISHQAKSQNIMANVVDSPSLCHFITPSIIDRSPMVFAISSEGTAPVLVRYWRARLESLIPSTLGQIADFSGRKRQLIKDKFSNSGARRRFWERFFSSSDSDNVKLLDPLFTRLVGTDEQEFSERGELYIVQVTDNEELLSLAALRHMQQSDMALVDKTVAQGVIELVRRDANIDILDQAHNNNQLRELLEDNQRVCILTKQPLNTWQDTIHQFESTYSVRQFNSALSIV